jgi:hypothetical protein
MRFKNYLWAVIPALLLSGCQSTFGPSSINDTHPYYNQAIADTISQQMLLNLVRLKYRDEMYFLKVGSVTSSISFGGNIGIGSNVPMGTPAASLSPNMGLNYSDHPTISYQPLQGEDFLKSFLAPIPLGSMLVLIQSGWNIERIFSLCIDRANDLYNSSNVSVIEKDNSATQNYKRMLKLFRTLQLDHSIEVGLDQTTRDLMILLRPNALNQGSIHELQSLLGVKAQDKSKMLFKVGTNFLTPLPNQINLSTRGLSGVMFYLAQRVASPQEHIDAGLVDPQVFTNIAYEDFSVKVSDSYPDGAFIAVPYRGYWFYIADNDLKSKSTFMLLSQLFDLQAGQSKYSGPTLTLPVN